METTPTPRPAHDVDLDVGDLLCGELALKLRTVLRGMEPGGVLRVTARDSAAPQDVPAWCEVTGHELLRSEPPRFWIRRKNP